MARVAGDFRRAGGRGLADFGHLLVEVHRHPQHAAGDALCGLRVGGKVELREIVALAHMTVLAADAKIQREAFHRRQELRTLNVLGKHLEVRELLRDLCAQRRRRYQKGEERDGSEQPAPWPPGTVTPCNPKDHLPMTLSVSASSASYSFFSTL
jgi:hypothetical protein